MHLLHEGILGQARFANFHLQGSLLQLILALITSTQSRLCDMHVAPPAGKGTLPSSVLAMACSKAPGTGERGKGEQADAI